MPAKKIAKKKNATPRRKQGLSQAKLQILEKRMLDIIGWGESAAFAEDQWMEQAVKTKDPVERKWFLGQAMNSLRVRNKLNIRSERIHRRLKKEKFYP